jgi:uncharacterized protein YutE (UPF0331/DUF86 family)
MLREGSPMEDFFQKTWNVLKETIDLSRLYNEVLSRLTEPLRYVDIEKLQEALFPLLSPPHRIEHLITTLLLADTLAMKIVACHYTLNRCLRSLLGVKSIKSTKEALEEAKRRGLINEKEFEVLRNFVEFRNKVLHANKLHEGSLEKREKDVNDALKIIEDVRKNVKTRNLEPFVECLEGPLLLF